MSQMISTIEKSGRKKNGRSLAVASIIIISFAMLFFVLTMTVMPRGRDIEVGQIAKETIKASRDIVDSYTTEMKRQAARDNTSSMYLQDDSITADVMNSLEECFAAMDTVRRMGEEERQRIQNESSPGTEPNIIYTISFLEECREVLPSSFSNGNILIILDMEQQELERLTETITRLVQDALEKGIKESVLAEQISGINQQLVSPENGFSEDAKALGINIISSYLKANFIYDADATEAARDAAEEDVQEEVYMAGQNIVVEGEIITQAQFYVLKELGFVREQKAIWMEYISILILLVLIYIAIGMFLRTGSREILQTPKLLFIMTLVVVLSILLTWAGKKIDVYIVPVIMAAMTLTLLMVDRNTALFVNMLLTILTAVIMLSDGEDKALIVAIAVFLGGAVSVFSIGHAYQRAALMLSGILSGLVMASVYVAFDLINYVNWKSMLVHAGLGISSGLIASVLTIGLLPMWESVFKIVTPMKLLELANPNQPLLKRLLMEAPGTYHHSIMVGNMGERAAEAIGANALVVRAGAYYHDIGKLKRPFFFSENQGGDNPHDNIKPDLSTRIITSHVSDGYELVKQHNLPPVIQNIVLEHHGTTPVAYFYHKAKTTSANPDDVKIDDFRYQGARPRTRESAIIMLADSVEAAVRSMDDPTSRSVEELIRKIFKTKMDDGQLTFCDLTLRELDVIAEQFKLALNGIFHDRVEYPGDEK